MALCFVINQPVQERAHKSHQNQQERNRAAEILVSATTYFPFTRQPQPTTDQDAPHEEPQHWYQYLWSQNASNWALVFVAGVGLWFARRSLKAAEVVANSGNISAKAALLSAQAVIKAERAWMVGWPDHSTEVDRGITYKCLIKNVGKTPARITEVSLAIRKVASVPKMNPEPTFEKNEKTPFNMIVVAPEDFIPGSISLDPELTGVEHDKLEIRALIVYAYGLVKYLDAFNGERETRFCHCYAITGTTKGFRPFLEAPRAYHEAT